jgi:hypothetical protein
VTAVFIKVELTFWTRCFGGVREAYKQLT